MLAPSQNLVLVAGEVIGVQVRKYTTNGEERKVYTPLVKSVNRNGDTTFENIIPLEIHNITPELKDALSPFQNGGGWLRAEARVQSNKSEDGSRYFSNISAFPSSVFVTALSNGSTATQEEEAGF